MAATTRRRNEWTLSLLEIRPDDRVLEIGYGPGVGITLASGLVDGGTVTGIDHSEAMRVQATRRNLKAVRQGKVRLFTGTIEEWPGFPHTFSKVFSINSAQFWADRPHVCRKLHNWLDPGGRIAITYQPVGKDAPGLNEFADQLARDLQQAGFVRIRRETKVLTIAPAVCVIAEKDAPSGVV
ncbi:class I SAM-dependent methyltransferase [Thermaerobacter litoralis]